MSPFEKAITKLNKLINQDKADANTVIDELASLLPIADLEKHVDEVEAEAAANDFIHEPECPEDDTCTCKPTGVTYRDGSPGFDHAAGYHD